MRAAFLSTSVLCGILLGLLAAIVGTGWIPLRKKPAQEPVREATVTTTVQLLGEETLNELIDALTVQRTNYLAQTRTLTENAQETEIKRQVVEKLAAELKRVRDEARRNIVEIEDSERANMRQLAEVYEEMEPESAVVVLGQMEEERAAKIVSLIDERGAAAILEAAVAVVEDGASVAAKWTDIMRRLKQEAKGKKKGT